MNRENEICTGRSKTSYPCCDKRFFSEKYMQLESEEVFDVKNEKSAKLGFEFDLSDPLVFCYIKGAFS